MPLIIRQFPLVSMPLRLIWQCKKFLNELFSVAVYQMDLDTMSLVSCYQCNISYSPEVPTRIVDSMSIHCILCFFSTFTSSHFSTEIVFVDYVFPGKL